MKIIDKLKGHPHAKVETAYTVLFGLMGTFLFVATVFYIVFQALHERLVRKRWADLNDVTEGRYD